jgi:hypothetical protein
MNQRATRLTTWGLGLLTAAGATLAVPMAAHAQTATDPTTSVATTDPSTTVPAPSITVAKSGVDTVTLPLFGVPLTVDVTTGAGGSLSNVAVNPAGTLTAGVKPNSVVFKTADGTGTIVVSGKDGRQSITVRAGGLADVSGPGRWSGDIFGTQMTTTVDFRVGAAADGSPDITGVVSSDVTAVIGATEHSSDEGEQTARVSVRFAANGQSRTLVIRVTVSTDPTDGTKRATLRMTLGKVKGDAQAASAVAGAHTYDGQLCNGNPSHIGYTIGTDGSISGVTATPTPDKVRDNRGGVDVVFSKTERVRIHTRVENGNIALDVSEHFECGVLPTTNVTIVPTPDSVPGNGEGGHGEGGRHHGGGDHSSGAGNGQPGDTGPVGSSGSRGEGHGKGRGHGNGNDNGGQG